MMCEIARGDRDTGATAMLSLKRVARDDTGSHKGMRE